MLKKLLDAGAYTVAGNVIVSVPGKPNVKLGELRNGELILLPEGEEFLAELTQKKKKKNEVFTDASLAEALGEDE